MYVSCINQYNVDFNTFNHKSYYEGYHHYEEFDSSKIYTFNHYIADYGYGKHTYQYWLDIFVNKTGFSKKKKFIVVREVLSLQERNELAKYCDCEYHTSTPLWQIFNPNNRFSDCVIQYNNYNYNQKAINRAREQMKKEWKLKQQSLLLNNNEPS